MSDELALLGAIVARPSEAGETWLVLADLLEERADPRHELIRLQHQPTFRPDLDAVGRQGRLVELLEAGVRPCVPRLTNAVGMSFVWVPPGSFTMGSPPDEPEREDDEDAHEVRITRPFYLGMCQVTQGEWEAVMGSNPSRFTGDAWCPVEMVSWEDSQEFCRRLTALPGEREAGRRYELPTEAEWEYACRAGTTTPFHFGGVLNGSQANCDGNYPYGTGTKGPFLERTKPVGSFAANAWGLHEMHGNVWEWCVDWYGAYAGLPDVDPVRSEESEHDARVLRGGSWDLDARYCRAACRLWDAPASRVVNIGLRVCCRLDGRPEGVKASCRPECEGWPGKARDRHVKGEGGK